MSTATLPDILERVELLAARRERLREIVTALNAGIEALKAERMPELREAIDLATLTWGNLVQDIQANPGLFERPRTQTAHGIKFGLAKGKGKVEIADPDKTVRLIKKHLPEKADLLIDVKETPAKDAIAMLPADDLKRIGCTVTGTGDQVVIRPVDGDVDKIVKALIASGADESAGENG